MSLAPVLLPDGSDKLVTLGAVDGPPGPPMPAPADPIGQTASEKMDGVEPEEMELGSAQHSNPKSGETEMDLTPVSHPHHPL